MLVVGLSASPARRRSGGLAVDQGMLFGREPLQGAFAALMAPAALSILTITFQHDAGRTSQSFRRLRSRLGGWSRHRRTGGRHPHRVRIVAVVPLINVPIALLAACRAVRASSARAGPAGQRYDIPGALLSTAGLGQLGLRVHQGRAPTAGHQRPPSRCIAVGVSLLAVFVVVEARSAYPLLPLRVVLERNRGGCLLGRTAQRRRPLRHVHLRELLHAADSSLLSSRSWGGIPSICARRGRGGRRFNQLVAKDRTPGWR